MSDSVNTLKCVNCNIVISEVLAFIQNKLDVIDNESLIRICVSAFSEEDIDIAKKLLFTSMKTKIKIISRRKNKKEKDIEDMLTTLKTAEPDQLPVFVAYNLEKLPPICFDHVDVTKLLKDLLLLREEINYIKSNYVTKQELDNSRKGDVNILNTPLSYINSNINMKRGGYLLDSGPIGLSHVSEASVCEVDTALQPPPAPATSSSFPRDARAARAACTSAETSARSADIGVVDVNNSLQYRSLCPSNVATGCAVPPAHVNSTLLDENVTVNDFTNKQMTMAEIVSKGEWKDKEVEGQWTYVQNRKSRNRFTGKMGTAQSSSTGGFKAADSVIPLFISNVNKETSDIDIRDYIKTKTGVTVKLEKINMKTERSYNAFKVFVSKFKLDTFLDDSLWPEGIRFRRFVFFKKANETKTQISSVNNIPNSGSVN